MAAFPSGNSGFYAPNSTSGWFQSTATTSNIYMAQPIYYAAQTEPEPPPKRSHDPLDWLRSRVQECVDRSVLA